MQHGSMPISRDRAALRNLLLLPVVILAVLLLLLALPVLLPLVGFQAKRDRRRLCAAAEVTPCGHCGRPLGLAAVEAADAAWTTFLDGMTKQGLRPRVIRWLFARCPSCGAGHSWDAYLYILHLLPVALWERSIPPG